MNAILKGQKETGCFSCFLTEALNQLTPVFKRTEYVGSNQ